MLVGHNVCIQSRHAWIFGCLATIAFTQMPSCATGSPVEYDQSLARLYTVIRTCTIWNAMHRSHEPFM